MLAKVKRALVVVAHPDDEVLMCGGLVSRLVNDGADVRVIFLTDGGQGRASATTSVSEYLGYKYHMYNLETSHLVADRRMHTLIDSELEMFRPCLVVTHCESVAQSQDHSIVSRAVQNSVRRKAPLATVIAGEPTLALSEFDPELYIDITSHFENKSRAVAAYALHGDRPYFDPAVVRAKGIWWSVVATGAALSKFEAFSVLRSVSLEDE